MLRTNSLRAALFLPAAIVIAMAGHATSAFADQFYVNLLQKKLQSFATDEGKTLPQANAVTTASASADDLVYAVYQVVTETAGTANATTLAEIAASALESVGTKTRADKDKIVGRILEAVIIASGKNTDAATITKILTRFSTLNSGNNKGLTAAGRELLVAKAIRATVGVGAAVAGTNTAGATGAEALFGTGALFTGATTEDKRKTFITAVVKQLAFKPQSEDPTQAGATAATAKATYFPVLSGVELTVKGEPAFAQGAPASILGAQSGVQDYIDKALIDFADKKGTAATIARSLAPTLPSVAGAVIGGYIQNLTTAGPNNTKVMSDLAEFIADTKLAKAQSYVVDFGFRSLTPSADGYATAAQTLAANQTAATKGNVASGAIRAATADSTHSTTATSIITKVLTATGGMAISTDAAYATFAGAAAVGNGGTPAVAGEIATAVINAETVGVGAADLTKIQNVAIAVIKSVAPVNPDAANSVGQALLTVIRGTSNPYTTDAARIALASALAKGAATNYTAAGAAVAGVVQKATSLDALTGTAAEDRAVLYSKSAITSASKAAVSIAQKVSKAMTFTGGVTSSTFAAKLGLATTTANAGAVAAGVSLTDTANSGVITRAVIDQSVALRKLALTIANTVAVNVDVEAIGFIAKEVGSLFQNSGANDTASGKPKLSTLGTLATSLAKAINTKPFVLWQNRADEMNELAAELVNVAISKNGTDPATLASIGTNIFKAASAKLLANTGNFAVDMKDVAQTIAGAIAQTIASSSLSDTAKSDLLTPTGTGSLQKLLMTAAKTNGGAVSDAFAQVNGTKVGGTYGTVPGIVKRSDGTLGAYEIGARYEIGEVGNPETRIKNI